MLSFRLNTKMQYGSTFDPTIVDKVEYFGLGDGIHNVYFNASTTGLEKESVLYAIQSSPGFEKFFVIATKTENFDKSYSENRWMETDMQLNIAFKDAQIPIEDVKAFAEEYQCHIVHAPGFEGGVYVLGVNDHHQLFDISSPMYNGDGIVVGVIDYHGVQWNHPDLDGSFLDGWVAFGLVEGEEAVIPIDIEGSNVYHMAWNEAHLQNVSGIISADMDNDEGSVGVAHNAKIIPCLMQGTTKIVKQ